MCSFSFGARFCLQMLIFNHLTGNIYCINAVFHISTLSVKLFKIQNLFHIRKNYLTASRMISVK